MKKHFCILIIFTTIFLFSCSNNNLTNSSNELSQEEQRKKAQLEIETSMYRFINENNFKNALLFDSDFIENKYSIDILNQVNGKECVFISIVKDIFKENDKMFIFLEELIGRYCYTLEINEDAYNIAKTIKKDSYDEVIVAANISDIKSNTYKVDKYDNDLKVETSSWTSIKGKCLRLSKFESDKKGEQK